MLTKLFDGSGIIISDITKNANIWLLTLTCHEFSCCKYELLMSAKNRWLYNTVAMEMFVVFNIPPFCSLDSFASHLFRVLFIWTKSRNKGFRGICALRVPFFALFIFWFFLNSIPLMQKTKVNKACNPMIEVVAPCYPMPAENLIPMVRVYRILSFLPSSKDLWKLLQFFVEKSSFRFCLWSPFASKLRSMFYLTSCWMPILDQFASRVVSIQ